MKNNFKIMIIAALLCSTLTFVSCSDFLTEDNKTGQTADVTYSTQSGINGLVAGCYSFARGFYGKEAGLGLGEGGTDLFYAGQDNKQRTLVQYTLTAASLDNAEVNNNPCLDHYWELFYCAVDACNNALKYIPECPAIDNKLKSQYLGEIYFLKAFYNFHIVNIWGDAPYNPEAIITSTSTPSRMKEAEIYTHILEDLDASIAKFDEAGYKTKADGRANYWAARALKARVLLYKASWLNDNASYQLAQNEAEAVIGSNIASFYPNYADTWYMENEDIAVNKEAIWGVTYSSDLKSTVNCIPKRYRTDADGEPLNYVNIITRTGYTRGGSAMLTMFVPLWNNGCTDINDGTIFKRALPGDVMLNGVDITWYSRYGRGFTRYLPSLYLWQTLEKYRATDQRTDASLLTAYTIVKGLEGRSTKYPNMQDTAIYYSALDGNSAEAQALQAYAKNKYRLQFAYGGEIPVYTSGNVATATPTQSAVPVSTVYGDNRYNAANIGGRSSFPALKKFLEWFNTKASDGVNITDELSYRDAVVLRLAEMYLIKAECQLKTSGSANALATLNALRTVRAISGKDNSRSGTVTIDTILEERAIELCGEQQRWFDLKRTGKLIEYVTARNAQASPNIKPFHVYRPIPDAQMNACTNVVPYPGSEGNFWQNEGY